MRSWRMWSVLILIAWAFVLFGSASAVSLQTPNKSRPSPQSENAQASKDPSPSIRITVSAQQQPSTPTNQTPSSQSNQQNNRQPRDGWFQRWIDRWLDPMVIVTVLVFIVYAFIFVAMVRQVGELRTTTEATRQLVQISQTAQRAWVGPTGTVSILGTIPIPIGPPIAFEVAIKNSGKTPALEVETQIMAKSVPTGTDFVPDYPPLPGALPHYGSKAVIQPETQVALTTQQSTPVTQEVIDALRSGRIVLYVYGKIDYKDIFQSAHHTTFCFFLHSTLDRISACKTYNTAD